jgi:hypothetical protein
VDHFPARPGPGSKELIVKKSPMRTVTFTVSLAALSAGMVAFSQMASTGQDARFRVTHSNANVYPLNGVYPDKASWEKREDFFRHQVLVANGLWPEPPKGPLNAVIHGAIDKGDFTVEKVYFTSYPGHYVTGNLYRPKNLKPGTKVPAVLHPYGHWGSGDAMGRFWWRDEKGLIKETTPDPTTGVVAETSLQGARSPLQATCANLAHMGCVVFEWDLVGYCDSNVIQHQIGFTDAEAVLRLQSFVGLQSWNGIRAYDFVTSLPEVDPKRVAVGGSSGGGTQTMQLGAVDMRIAAFFPMVMVSMHGQGGCVCENAPLLRVGSNNVEIAELMAPRPQFDCGATGDNTADYATNGFPQMRHIYELLGVPNNVDFATLVAPHNHNVHSRELFYNFINKTFNLGIPGTIVESPIEPIPYKELSVWDAQHPRPADFADAPTLRAWMTRTSDEQLAALEKDSAAYRATLLTALKAMVVDELPTAAEVETTLDWSRADAPQSGTIGRKGAGEAIPISAIKPAAWNGTVVIWSDPRGSAALAAKERDGALEVALSSGAAVIAMDAYMSGNFRPAGGAGGRRGGGSNPGSATAPVGSTAPAAGRAPPAANRTSYDGYTLGYDRSIVANRVHDLLTTIAYARGIAGVKSVRLIGTGDTGLQVVLAAALAGPAIDRTAADLQGFDFDKVQNDKDPLILPGGLKYGGIYGFASLTADPSRKTLLINARETGQFAFAAKTENLTLDRAERTASDLAKWVMQ